MQSGRFAAIADVLRQSLFGWSSPAAWDVPADYRMRLPTESAGMSMRRAAPAGLLLFVNLSNGLDHPCKFNFGVEALASPGGP